MSNYKTHSYFNLFLFLPLSLAVCYFFITKNMPKLMSFSGAFAYGTLFMSPDLDYANKVKWLSIRGILSLPFRSYAKCFRHRGLSHSLLFGTLTRIIWLGVHLLVILFIIYQNTTGIQNFYLYIKKHEGLIIYGLLGLFIADIGHLLLDKRL